MPVRFKIGEETYEFSKFGTKYDKTRKEHVSSGLGVDFKSLQTCSQIAELANDKEWSKAFFDNHRSWEWAKEFDELVLGPNVKESMANTNRRRNIGSKVMFQIAQDTPPLKAAYSKKSENKKQEHVGSESILLYKLAKKLIMRAPNIILLGSPKTGTSKLFDCVFRELSKPCCNRIKEPFFFLFNRNAIQEAVERV